jgi:hypothetical protein
MIPSRALSALLNSGLALEIGEFDDPRHMP